MAAVRALILTDVWNNFRFLNRIRFLSSFQCRNWCVLRFAGLPEACLRFWNTLHVLLILLLLLQLLSGSVLLALHSGMQGRCWYENAGIWFLLSVHQFLKYGRSHLRKILLSQLYRSCWQEKFPGYLHGHGRCFGGSPSHFWCTECRSVPGLPHPGLWSFPDAERSSCQRIPEGNPIRRYKKRRKWPLRLSALTSRLWQRDGVCQSRHWWRSLWQYRCLKTGHKPPADSSHNRRQNIPLRSQGRILSSHRKAAPREFCCGRGWGLVCLAGRWRSPW